MNLPKVSTTLCVINIIVMQYLTALGIATETQAISVTAWGLLGLSIAWLLVDNAVTVWSVHRQTSADEPSTDYDSDTDTYRIEGVVFPAGFFRSAKTVASGVMNLTMQSGVVLGWQRPQVMTADPSWSDASQQISATLKQINEEPDELLAEANPTPAPAHPDTNRMDIAQSVNNMIMNGGGTDDDGANTGSAIGNTGNV